MHLGDFIWLMAALALAASIAGVVLVTGRSGVHVRRFTAAALASLLVTAAVLLLTVDTYVY